MRTRALHFEERKTIYSKLIDGYSFRLIARLLNRDHTTIAREVERNGGRWSYRPIKAQQRADTNKQRPNLRR